MTRDCKATANKRWIDSQRRLAALEREVAELKRLVAGYLIPEWNNQRDDGK